MTAQKLTGSLRSVGEALKQIRTRLDQIERETERLMTEREVIRTAPCTRKEAVAKLDTHLAELRRKADAYLAHQASGLAYGREPDLSRLFEQGGANGVAPAPRMSIGLLADTVRTRMVEAIEASSRFREDSLPLAERPKAIAKLDEQIEKLEGEREELLNELRGAGFEVDEALEPVEPEDTAHRINATESKRFSQADADALNEASGGNSEKEA